MHITYTYSSHEYYHSPLIAYQAYSISNQSHKQKSITLLHQFHHLENIIIHVIFSHFT